MKTYHQGYDFSTQLTDLVLEGSLPKHRLQTLAHLSPRKSPFRQGAIDAANDGLHKISIFEKELSCHDLSLQKSNSTA